MALIFGLITILTILVAHQAEWIEITQQPKVDATTTKNQTKTNTIRILKRNEAELLFNSENTTPSPQWIEYQRERFGQQQNSNTHKLIVSTENHLKNSIKIIVPANTKPQSQIIQTKARLNVINERPKDELIELPSLPQLTTSQTTTTKRDMSNAQIHQNDDEDEFQEYVEVVENVDETEAEAEANNAAEKPVTVESNNQNEIQMPSWQGFLKFLKTIQSNWLKHSAFSIEDKIRLLKNLRDSLMRKIEEQFFMIWTPKERLRRRRKRGILDEATINFPPEAALMSINFLTFAVFLIKLVLQIVHIIRSKHYNFTGLGLATQAFGKTTLKT